MPRKHLKNSLQEYLSKMKKTPSSKNWILPGCKHTKTLSLSNIDHNQNKDRKNKEDDGGAATLADIDRFLYENFKSLYLQDDDDENKTTGKKEGGGGRSDGSPEGILFPSPRLVEPPPDLCGSHRFFVAPGTSGSLMEEARTSLTISSEVGSASTSASASTSTTNYKTLNPETSSGSNGSKDGTLPDDCIAILTYSASPYNDFRRSMQQMVDARLQHQAKVDWDFMEELLFCYLNLNDKKSYKFILRAFVDLVVLLRQNSNRNPVPARSRNFRIARERRRRSRHVNVRFLQQVPKKN